jgi:hypothetical protein
MSFALLRQGFHKKTRTPSLPFLEFLFQSSFPPGLVSRRVLIFFVIDNESPIGFGHFSIVFFLIVVVFLLVIRIELFLCQGIG